MSAQIGTISHGTLRTQDLLRAFADALKSIAGAPQIDPCYGSCLIADAREWADCLDSEPTLDEEETAQQVLMNISDRLNELAPEGCYFGSHPGDGADFGFWPIEGDE